MVDETLPSLLFARRLRLIPDSMNRKSSNTSTIAMNHQAAKPDARLATPDPRAAGFTLIEAALTMVIVGVGVLAMVSAQQAYHMKNDWANRTGTAQMLANEIREMTLSLPQHDPISGNANLGVETNEIVSGSADPQKDVINYDDLDDFAGMIDGAGEGSGVTFNPPINGLRAEVADLDRWRQQVEVTKVLPDDINTSLGLLGLTDLMRVTVTVGYRPGSATEFDNITSMTWVVTR